MLLGSALASLLLNEIGVALKITSAMLVPEGTDLTDAIIRTCKVCGEKSFHIPSHVTVMSKGGARGMTLWFCENHPIPEFITDEPDAQ